MVTLFSTYPSASVIWPFVIDYIKLSDCCGTVWTFDLRQDCAR
jgi:hypothetical protein